DVDGLRHGITSRGPCRRQRRGGQGLTPSGRFFLGQVLVRLAGGAHPATPDMALTIAPKVPRHQSESAADGAGAARGTGRDRLVEIRTALNRDVGHGAHMIGSVPRFVKADLLYFARRVACGSSGSAWPS